MAGTTQSTTGDQSGNETGDGGRSGSIGGEAGSESEGMPAAAYGGAGDAERTGNQDGAGGGLPGTGDDGESEGAPTAVYGNARTDSEKLEELDRELDEKLAGFDGIILDRRREVVESDNEQGGGSSSGRRARQSAAGTAMGGAQGADESGESAPLLTATAEDTGNVITRGNRPDISPDGREGDYKRGDAPEDRDDRIPEDIPSGDDDDIVARQLREAAMQEEDPELREKLWDEYRKYKESVQAKR